MRKTKLGLESLDARSLPSTATLAGSVLTIDGTEARDVIIVREHNGSIDVRGVSIFVAGNAEASVPLNQVSRIVARGFGGNDVINLSKVSVPSTIDGGNGHDAIIGGSASDSIVGGDGNDVITGGEGDDDIDGGNGNDNLAGAGGDDSLAGESGNDRLAGGIGNDSLEGGDGIDSESGGLGNDTIHGGAGPDLIDGDAGDDSLFGDSGNDLVRGGIGDDSIEAGDGIDRAFGGVGDDSIAGGIGNDLLSGDAGDDSVTGGDGNDTIAGSSGDDSLNGESGDDRLAGGIGDDSVNGGLDDDTIQGDTGDDRLNGEAGDDVLSGGVGDDSIRGGDGNDSESGGSGRDHLNGESGDDSLNGGLGNDDLRGEAGDDSLMGDLGDDSLYGGTGSDRLRGHGGNDRVHGGLGDDDCDGGSGNDEVNGDSGNDLNRNGESKGTGEDLRTSLANSNGDVLGVGELNLRNGLAELEVEIYTGASGRIFNVSIDVAGDGTALVSIGQFRTNSLGHGEFERHNLAGLPTLTSGVSRVIVTPAVADASLDLTGTLKANTATGAGSEFKATLNNPLDPHGLLNGKAEFNGATGAFELKFSGANDNSNYQIYVNGDSTTGVLLGSTHTDSKGRGKLELSSIAATIASGSKVVVTDQSNSIILSGSFAVDYDDN